MHHSPVFERASDFRRIHTLSESEQDESSLSVQSVWLKYDTRVVNLGRLEHNSTSMPEVKHT